MKKLILAGAAIAVLAAGIVGVVLAQPRPEADSKKGGVAVRNAELAAKQRSMIDAAQRTLAAFEESFNYGKLLPNEAYDWSSRIRSAQVRTTDSRQQATKASQEHLKRMQVLHSKVAAASKEGAVGGEPQKLFAAEFYVAEAEVLLLEARGSEN
jgi:hypothetical protein